MTTQEMRELDAWLQDNIPGIASNESPTRNHAASDVLDDKILEKIQDGYEIQFLNGFYTFKALCRRISQTHHDKKICRALFAKKLFTK